jgi:hypothetical protein
MTDRIGTCSLCGGDVVTSGYMGSTHCNRCGAIPKTPVIPMVKPRMPKPAHLTWVEDGKLSVIQDSQHHGRHCSCDYCRA